MKKLLQVAIEKIEKYVEYIPFHISETIQTNSQK